MSCLCYPLGGIFSQSCVCEKENQMSGVSQCQCGCWVEFNENGVPPVTSDNTSTEENRAVEVVLHAVEDDGSRVLHYFDNEGDHFGISNYNSAVVIYDGDGGVIGFFPRENVLSVRYW